MIDIKLELDDLLKQVETAVNKIKGGYVKYSSIDLIFLKEYKHDITFFKNYYNDQIVSIYNSIIWDSLEICSDYNLHKFDIMHYILSDNTFVELNKLERFYQIYNVLNILYYVQPTYDFYLNNELYNSWNITTAHTNIEDYSSSFGDNSLINIKSSIYNNNNDSNIFVKLENIIRTNYLETSFIDVVYDYFYDKYWNEVNMNNIGKFQSYKNIPFKDILYRNYIKYTLNLFNQYFESIKKQYDENHTTKESKRSK